MYAHLTLWSYCSALKIKIKTWRLLHTTPPFRSCLINSHKGRDTWVHCVHISFGCRCCLCWFLVRSIEGRVTAGTLNSWDLKSSASSSKNKLYKHSEKTILKVAFVKQGSISSGGPKELGLQIPYSKCPNVRLFEYKWKPHPLGCRGRENEESELSSKWLFCSEGSLVVDATRAADNVFSMFSFHLFCMTILLLSSPCRKFCFAYTYFSSSFISPILPCVHPFETMRSVVASHFYLSTNILRASDN